MKTFILASLLALTAMSGVVAASQSAAANTPKAPPVHVSGHAIANPPYCACVGGPGKRPAAPGSN